MLKFKKPDPVAVQVEDQTVHVHPLNAGQFAELLQGIEGFKKSGDQHKADFLLLFMSVKDAEGKSVFGSTEEAMELPVSVVAALLPVCLKVNGMGQQDEKKD